MATVPAASDVRVWPSLSQAARYLGVDKATLSRRRDLERERVGPQQVRLSPATVMRLAREYRKRVVDEVAFDLVEHARQRVPDQTAAVEEEIDGVLATTSPVQPGELTTFLAMAETYLPRDLYRLVSAAVSQEDPASRGVLGEDPSSAARARPSSERPVSRRRNRTTAPRGAVRA